MLCFEEQLHKEEAWTSLQDWTYKGRKVNIKKAYRIAVFEFLSGPRHLLTSDFSTALSA